MKWNLSRIMLKAWELYRKGGLSFSESLHRAWNVEKSREINQQRVAEAKERAGIFEEVDTWAGWQRNGFLVTHGSKRLFSVSLIWASKGDNKYYTASFFGKSQVEALA